jgi:hypothetical protein
MSGSGEVSRAASVFGFSPDEQSVAELLSVGGWLADTFVLPLGRQTW